MLYLLVGSNYLQSQSDSCVEGTISVLGDPNLTLCLDDGIDDEIRFRSDPQATPYAYIVVDEDNVLLIYPKDKEQEIKQVSKDLASKFGKQYL